MVVPAYTSSPPAATELGSVRGMMELGSKSRTGASSCAGLGCCSPSSQGERRPCLLENKVGKSAKAQAPSFAVSPSGVGANKQVWGAEGAQGLCGAGRRQQCNVQCCFRGKRLLSSPSHCAGCSAVATALAVCLLTSFWLLQLFSCPVSGLLCLQHRCFSHQAASPKARQTWSLPVRWTVPRWRAFLRLGTIAAEMLARGETGAAHLAKMVCV